MVVLLVVVFASDDGDDRENKEDRRGGTEYSMVAVSSGIPAPHTELGRYDAKQKDGK